MTHTMCNTYCLYSRIPKIRQRRTTLVTFSHISLQIDQRIHGCRCRRRRQH